jgi:Rps23 Pro-64 3,4-dihydroxylase Tpa1-like proline 4-hydroxylase
VWWSFILRFKSADYRKRKITAILYLNVPDWSAEDGGELRCYIDATLADKKNDATAVSSKNVVSVYPVGGVMVLFDSRMLLHDVAPCRSDRYALTLWIIGDDNNDKK